MVAQTPAIVLKSFPYGETSLIARCFTRDYGKISLLARGARRNKSPLTASFQPGNYLELVLSIKETRELQILNKATFIETWNSFSDDLKKMGYALSVIELVDRSITDRDVHEDLFDTLVDTLRTIQNQNERLNLVFWQFQLRLLTFLGFRPDLKQREIHGVRLPDPKGGPNSLKILELMAGSIQDVPGNLHPTAKDRKTIQDYLSACFRVHVEGFTELKSFKVLRELLA